MKIKKILSVGVLTFVALFVLTSNVNAETGELVPSNVTFEKNDLIAVEVTSLERYEEKTYQRTDANFYIESAKVDKEALLLEKQIKTYEKLFNEGGGAYDFDADVYRETRDLKQSVKANPNRAVGNLITFLGSEEGREMGKSVLETFETVKDNTDLIKAFKDFWQSVTS